MKIRPYSVLCCMALLVLSACSLCDQERISDTTSPDGSLTATVVYIGCGAITKDATWVTLHRKGDKYDRSNEIVFSTVQQQQVDVSWKDASHLSIYCHCHDDDVRFQVTKKGNIKISYN